jgi:hypothetical protein
MPVVGEIGPARISATADERRVVSGLSVVLWRRTRLRLLILPSRLQRGLSHDPSDRPDGGRQSGPRRPVGHAGTGACLDLDAVRGRRSVVLANEIPDTPQLKATLECAPGSGVAKVSVYGGGARRRDRHRHLRDGTGSGPDRGAGGRDGKLTVAVRTDHPVFGQFISSGDLSIAVGDQRQSVDVEAGPSCQAAPLRRPLRRMTNKDRRVNTARLAGVVASSRPWPPPARPRAKLRPRPWPPAGRPSRSPASTGSIIPRRPRRSCCTASRPATTCVSAWPARRARAGWRSPPTPRTGCARSIWNPAARPSASGPGRSLGTGRRRLPDRTGRDLGAGVPALPPRRLAGPMAWQTRETYVPHPAAAPDIERFFAFCG